jgi:HEXXH motif-containing protein
LITTHSLSADAFRELADGAGDGTVVRQLREAQLSRHLMLLHVVNQNAAGSKPPSPATAAFDAGYHLLARVQTVNPNLVARLFSLPQVGSWARDCMTSMNNGSPPDFGYLAGVAAAAAVQAGVRFELDIPVTGGCVQLPGLGRLRVPSRDGWIKLNGDGQRLRAGDTVDVACTDLVPDDGSGDAVPYWRGTPLVRTAVGDQTWEVLLEDTDRYLDRYELSRLIGMRAAEVAEWRQLIQAAWQLLVRHHQWAAGPVEAGIDAIVPLQSRSYLDSATSPAALGAIATSLPSSVVGMAETLVHELQHIKLCGLIDMLPLIEPNDELGYAPWRDDARPLGGLLQGAYAFTGIVRFWDAQRRLEFEPDEVLRANVLYERWRLAIERVAGTLLGSGHLTPEGVRFVTVLRERARRGESAPVPAEAIEIAREVALHNWLTWQLRHTALDAAVVTELVTAYRRGAPLGDQVISAVRLEDDTRTVKSGLSRVLDMRYQQPQQYRQLLAEDTLELGAADALLIGGDAHAAVAGYRAELAAGPDTAAWIGLALAVHRLPAMPSREAFTIHLPLLFEMHADLARRGIHTDPLELAEWFK